MEITVENIEARDLPMCKVCDIRMIPTRTWLLPSARLTSDGKQTIVQMVTGECKNCGKTFRKGIKKFVVEESE